MKTVLIADDSLFMRKYMADLLQRENRYQVIAEASDGIRAVEQYYLYTPDIVLMDITMPIMDGRMALKEIIRINPRANVVMVSSLATRFHIQECLQLGGRDFVIKPYFENLISILDKIA